MCGPVVVGPYLLKRTKFCDLSVPERLAKQCRIVKNCRLSVTIYFCRTDVRIPRTFRLEITEEALSCESKLVRSIEHVQFRIDLQHTNRAVLMVNVTSHMRTTSRIVYPRVYDSADSPQSYNNLVVTSVHFWGESVLGNWTIAITEDKSFDVNGVGK